MNPETAKKLWAQLPWYVKLGLPVFIVMLFFRRGRDLLSSWVDSKARSKSDAERTKLDTEIAGLRREDDRVSGSIERLKEERDKESKEASESDTVSFHNGRKKGKPRAP